MNQCIDCDFQCQGSIEAEKYNDVDQETFEEDMLPFNTIINRLEKYLTFLQISSRMQNSQISS